MMSIDSSTALINRTCDPQALHKVALLLPLPIIGVLTNVIVGCAATFYRKALLRQNYVYLCVISTLLSNVVFLAVNLWDSSDTVEAVVTLELTNENGMKKTLWVVCQAAAASMLFVMSWNLCALIYVMLNTTYFHSAAKNTKQTSTVSTLARKRWRTVFLIIFSWTIPTAMAVVGVIKWNCGKKCYCIHGAKGELCPFSEGCSRVWPPLKNGFMALQVGLWFLEIIALIAFVTSGFHEFLRFAGSTRNGNGLANHLQDDAANHKTSTENENGPHHQIESIAMKRKRIPSWRSWNSRLQLAVVLSALFALLTVASIISFFIDISAVDFHFEIARAVSQTLVHLYAFLCPIMMVHFMPNLRKAVMRLFTAILFCFS